jgi:hypothetical protein
MALDWATDHALSNLIVSSMCLLMRDVVSLTIFILAIEVLPSASVV